MFARRIVDVELGAADHLLRVVEFVRLRRMADVACMDHERRLSRHPRDLVDRGVQRDARVRIGGLGEADVAVGNLNEGKAAFRCFRRADQPRCGHAAGDRPNHAGSGPQHAFQSLPAVEARLRDRVTFEFPLLRRKAPFKEGTQGPCGLFPRGAQKNLARFFRARRFWPRSRAWNRSAPARVRRSENRNHRSGRWRR